MGYFTKSLIILLLSAVAQAQQVLPGRDGFVYLVNNNNFFITCEIDTNAGLSTWQLYPGQSSGGYHWIKILECW
jgi:hypothetical protein